MVASFAAASEERFVGSSVMWCDMHLGIRNARPLRRCVISFRAFGPLAYVVIVSDVRVRARILADVASGARAFECERG